MAAPTATARGTPAVGLAMKDGYRSLIAFASNPNVLFWEKANKGPGLDGGDSINVTTMHFGSWRGFRSRSLMTLTEITTKAAFHPLVLPQIQAMVNLEQAITFHWPTGNYTAFWGFLRVFDVDDLVEGTQPEATVTITPTNIDPSTGAEAGPVTGTS